MQNLKKESDEDYRKDSIYVNLYLYHLSSCGENSAVDFNLRYSFIHNGMSNRNDATATVMRNPNVRFQEISDRYPIYIILTTNCPNAAPTPPVPSIMPATVARASWLFCTSSFCARSAATAEEMIFEAPLMRNPHIGVSTKKIK